MNTALYINKISAKLFTNLILLEGFKQIQHQVYTVVLANLPILSSYYAGFVIGLVKDINWTKSLSLYQDNLLLELKNLKNLRRYSLITGFQIAMEKEYNNLK